MPEDLTGKIVLDIGCNVGQMSHISYERGAKVIAFDYDRRVLELANQVHPGPRYYRANIDRYPKSFSSILEHEYDLVFCLSVINHVNKAKMAKFLKDLNWREIIFEGHQNRFNLHDDLIQFVIKYHIPGEVKFKGISEERHPRPAWLLTRK